MDILHTLTNWIDHNRYKMAAGLLILGILAYGLVCELQTQAPDGSGEKITAAEFQLQAGQLAAQATGDRARLMAEVEAFNAQAAAIEARIAAGEADLARQAEIRAELFTIAGGVIAQATAGDITTGGIVGSALAAIGLLGGFGAYADSRRKDTVIKSQKHTLEALRRIKSE